MEELYRKETIRSIKKFVIVVFLLMIVNVVSASSVDCKISPNRVTANVGQLKYLTITCFDEQHQQTTCPLLRWYSDNNAIKIRPLGDPLGAVFWFKYFAPKAKITAAPYYQQQPSFGCSISAFAYSPTRVQAKKVTR